MVVTNERFLDICIYVLKSYAFSIILLFESDFLDEARDSILTSGLPIS